MSSSRRRCALALALVTTATAGLPATAGAMPAGPDPPAGKVSGPPPGDPYVSADVPPARAGGIAPARGDDDAPVALLVVSGGVLAAVAATGAYAGRHPRHVRLG